jgi:hypothetical protein
MKLSTMLIPVGSAALALLLSCGGGKVVVLPAPASPTPVASNFAPPAPNSVVVTTVPATPAPPATVSQLGPSPGPDYIRVEGYYNWLGDHYEWVPPTWVRAPSAGATFIPGHWQQTAGGYSWMPGYWR